MPQGVRERKHRFAVDLDGTGPHQVRRLASDQLGALRAITVRLDRAVWSGGRLVLAAGGIGGRRHRVHHHRHLGELDTHVISPLLGLRGDQLPGGASAVVHFLTAGTVGFGVTCQRWVGAALPGSRTGHRGSARRCSPCRQPRTRRAGSRRHRPRGPRSQRPAPGCSPAAQHRLEDAAAPPVGSRPAELSQSPFSSISPTENLPSLSATPYSRIPPRRAHHVFRGLPIRDVPRGGLAFKST